MTTGLFTHPVCIDHQTPPGHPESPDRLRYVMNSLSNEVFDNLKRVEAPLGDMDHVKLVHPQTHIDHLLSALPEEGHDPHALDGDTFLSPLSIEAALRAVGAMTMAIDQVMAEELENAFCAVRPPGHHAEPGRAMGFCLFNTAAIGALYAQRHHFQHRVAMIDFDVHHGNGSQTVAETHKNIFYGSSHQSPLYPGTGHIHDQGQGVIVNAPLAAGSGGEAFRRVYEERIFPALEEFNPDFMIISAGFDAHALDPLAELMLVEEDFAWITERLCEISHECCNGRLVSCLEGGYNLPVLGESVAAHVAALMA